MKKIFTFLIIIGLLFFTNIALSATPAAPSTGKTSQSGPDINSLTSKVAGGAGYQTAGVTDTSISETIGSIIRTLMSLLGIVFLGLTVYAGILWMTAGGNDDRVEKAIKIFTRSAVGLVIIIASYSITYFALVYLTKSVTSTKQVGTNPQTQSSGGFGSGFVSGFLNGAKKMGE